jgi:hypothetical protein
LRESNFTRIARRWSIVFALETESNAHGKILATAAGSLLIFGSHPFCIERIYTSRMYMKYHTKVLCVIRLPNPFFYFSS